MFTFDFLLKNMEKRVSENYKKFQPLFILIILVYYLSNTYLLIAKMYYLIWKQIENNRNISKRKKG